MVNKELFPLCFVVNGERIKTEIQLSIEERDLLNSLPPCKHGEENELQKQIPSVLLHKIKNLASIVIKDWAILYNYNNGLYNLSVNKWFLKDLVEEKFCKRVHSEKNVFIDPLTANVYLRDDEELFELWQEYERGIVKNQGVEYLKARYASEISEQTCISKIKWTLEF